MFWFLYKFSLAGMNYGTTGEIQTSGELQTIELTKKIFSGRKKLVLFDVGANTGQFVSILTSTFSSKAHIFAFEPASATFKKLKTHTNLKSNVVIEEIGLGEKEETADLFSDTSTSGLASLYNRELSHIDLSLSRKEKVRLTTLDNYCAKKKIKHIHFLKLDVEGNELNVLKGASSLLSKNSIDILQFEFGGCNLDSRTYFKDFFLLLHDDFHIYRVLQHGYEPISNYHEMLEVFLNSNFVAIRKDLNVII